jgi:hypothetical protein
MITGHQYTGGATPTSGSGIGMGLSGNGAELKFAANKAVTAEDVVYRIATVTAVISLLATLL